MLFDPLLKITSRWVHSTTVAGSSVVTGVNTARNVLGNLAQGRLVQATSTAISGTVGFWYEIGTSVGLATFLVNPPAPEALFVEARDWELLEGTTARNKLEAFTQNPNDPEAFRRAAQVLCVAATLAYIEQDGTEQILEAHAASSWTPLVLSSGNVQATLFVSQDTSVAILAFRGTEFPETDLTREFLPDWVRNFTAVPTRYFDDNEDIQVSMGFLDGWRALSGQVLGAIRRAAAAAAAAAQQKGQKLDLYVTGHSQGAALAAVSLLDLAEAAAHEPDNASFTLRACINIATPRVGNLAFAEHVNANLDFPVENVVNTDANGTTDPVVSAPPLVDYLDRQPGRLWQVQIGETTKGPLTTLEHTALANVHPVTFAPRAVLGAPLHWTGGWIGYIRAMDS